MLMKAEELEFSYCGLSLTGSYAMFASVDIAIVDIETCGDLEVTSSYIDDSLLSELLCVALLDFWFLHISRQMIVVKIAPLVNRINASVDIAVTSTLFVPIMHVRV